MKIYGLLLASLSLLGVGGVFAQDVEYDDMYFTSEDRAKLRAQNSMDVAYRAPSKAKKFDIENDDTRINPTDSYSARNVNPEYTSREHTQTAQADEQDYFVENYRHDSNELNNWNNNFNGWYNNAWYRNNYYGPAINRWNSPYYGYNSWNSPWYDPYWANNGWSSSFSFHYGSAWNYGWGGNYNYWNRPYYGWNDPFYSPYYAGYAGMGWYGGGYWNSWRYPGVIIVNDGGYGRTVTHGRRPARSTNAVSDRNSVRSRSSVADSHAPSRDNQSGRVTTQTRKQEEYYNRYNSTRSTSPSTTYGSRSSTQQNRSRSTDSWNNSSWDSNRSTNRSSSPSYSPSRSSSGSGSSTSGSSGRRGRQ